MRFFRPALAKQYSADTLLARIPRLSAASGPLFSYSNPLENPETHKYDPKQYYAKMPDLFVGVRANGVRAIRSHCQDGLFSVIPYKDPGDRRRHALYEFLYGTDVVYGDCDYDANTHPIKRPGVALHPGSPKSQFIYRGDLNPHLGHGVLHAINKWEEYCMIEKYAPGVMLKTQRINDLPLFHDSDLMTQRVNLMDQLTQNNWSISASLQQRLTAFLKTLIDHINRLFPTGAVLNGMATCYSSDGGTMFMSNAAQAPAIVSAFIRECNAVSVKSIASIRAHLLNQSNNSPLILFESLFCPDHIIVTPYVDLMQTKQGYPLECRADVVDGDVVTVWLRHPSTEYYPAEVEQVKRFIASLREKLPVACQHMSFGADVAFLKDGSIRLIEMNPGGDSGFLKLCLLYNVFVSNISGKKTPLLKTLNTVSKQSLGVQHQFLSGLKNTILMHPDINDSVEIGIYLRDLHIKRWHETYGTLPTEKEQCQLMKRLSKIFSFHPAKDPFRSEELLLSTQQYLDRCHAGYQSANRFQMR